MGEVVYGVDFQTKQRGQSNVLGLCALGQEILKAVAEESDALVYESSLGFVGFADADTKEIARHFEPEDEPVA